MNEEEKKAIEAKLRKFCDSQDAHTGALLNLFIEANKMASKEQFITGLRYIANHYKSKDIIAAEEFEKELGQEILKEILNAIK